MRMRLLPSNQARILLATASLLLAGVVHAADLPRLERRGEATQLIVDGDPYLILGGELRNSSASSLDYMKPIWPRLAAGNLNTVLAVVSWGEVEPEEGKFDWNVVDGLVKAARDHDLRLILLWFGSWKNGFSHYVPEWVKADYRRFPRARISAGTPEILSTLAPANLEADRRAYVAFMRHLKEIDGGRNTVVMVQMQNEVGLHGDSRDRSEPANAAFTAPVPRQFMDYLAAHKDNLLPEFRALWERTGFRSSGTWEEVFGRGPKTDEVFMGWNYARYCDQLAAAGKEIHPLPVFVNAWIVQPQDKAPGDYPSGGPQGHMLDVWRAGSPHIDVYAPDIYLPNFAEVCAEFTRNDNVLFVPESIAGERGIGNAFLTVGEFRGLGYSPFGIDSRLTDPENDPFAKAYGVLRTIAPMILEHQSQGTIRAAVVTPDAGNQNIEMGDYVLQVELPQRRRFGGEPPQRGHVLIMQAGSDEFFVAGGSAQVTFASRSFPDQTVGLAVVQEGVFEDGDWVPGRTLNGDEIMISYEVAEQVANGQTGTGLRFGASEPTILRVKLYRFE